MVLRMKNFNILGFHWKIWLLGEGVSQKTNIEGGGGLPKKGGLARKSGWCFWGGADTPMYAMRKR